MGDCYVTTHGNKEVLLSEGGSHWGQPDWAEYKYIDFGDGGINEFHLTAVGSGSVSVIVEGGTELCSVELDCNSVQGFSAPISPINGVHSLWLILKGKFALRDFRFK